MSAKNRARKSTGTRGLSVAASPQSSTQPNRTRNQASAVQSTPSTSRLISRPNTSRGAAIDSDDDEQSTLRLSNGRNRNSSTSESTSETTSDSDEAPGRVKLTPKNTKVPKKKKKVLRKKNYSSDTSDMSVQPSSSSNRASVSSKSNQSYSSPNTTTMLSSNMTALVNKCVYYFLVADQKKTWIKRADIQSHVFTPSESRHFSEVLTEAGAVLKKTYGLEILPSQKRKGEYKYMLINILNQKNVQEYFDYSPQELQKRGFILYLLTLIFMNERSITSDELAIALKPLGIDLNAKSHPLFGDMKKFLKELIHQNYVESKVTNKDPPQYELSWGMRAYQEVEKEDLLKFACQIMGDARPEEWILQYNDAMGLAQVQENTNDNQ